MKPTILERLQMAWLATQMACQMGWSFVKEVAWALTVGLWKRKRG